MKLIIILMITLLSSCENSSSLPYCSEGEIIEKTRIAPRVIAHVLPYEQYKSITGYKHKPGENYMYREIHISVQYVLQLECGKITVSRREFEYYMKGDYYEPNKTD